MSPDESHARTGAALRLHKRLVLRAGFGMVIALLLFATIKAVQIQGALSDRAVEIYRRHAEDDEVLHVLRRTLWLAASAGRDYLLNPFPGRTDAYTEQLRGLRAESRKLVGQLGRGSASRQAARALKPEFEAFWNALEAIPAATQGMDAAARYRFVQREIAPRRSAIGDVIQAFAVSSQAAFEESEAEFLATRRFAANRLFLTLGLSVLLGLVVAGASLARAEKLEGQTARQYEEMERARAGLQRLSARLMEVQEEERTRLSRELHDEVVQTLATLRMEISRLQAVAGQKLPEVRDRLASAGELAERSIRTTRNISLLLRPSLLDDLGLGAALQSLAEDFTRRTATPCEFHEEGLQHALPDAVRTCVYRVLQEALHNCEKHAAATRVRISIRQEPDLLTAAVSDDGRGFDVALATLAQSTRFGLLGMRERAAAIGGELDIESAPAGGACLTLRIPLQAAAASAGKARA